MAAFQRGLCQRHGSPNCRCGAQRKRSRRRQKSTGRGHIIDFSELFTQRTRELLPLARRKQLISFFDYLGPLIEVPDDCARLKAGIHRLMRGLVDMFEAGFVMFDASVQAPIDGESAVTVHAAGTGHAPAEAVERVLRRLGLKPLRAKPDDAARGRFFATVEGPCPSTGGTVTFVDAGRDGMVLSLEFRTRAMALEPADPVPNAGGAWAWLVSARAGQLDSVERRLHRSGWRVQRFGSMAKAQLSLTGAAGTLSNSPLLLIAAEEAGDELTMLEQVASAEPALWTVLAVVAGSPALQRREGSPVDIRVLPLSPSEMDRFAAHVDFRTSTTESRETAPMPLYTRSRLRVLVVDDNEVNQLLASALLSMLGYDVVVAGDGAAAIDACRRAAPDLVLMDLDMPVMGGLQATCRIRDMQEVGSLAPFPIVAATSAQHAGCKEECLQAGMDGYLEKPLVMQTLAIELARVVPTLPRSGAAEH